MLIHGEVYVRKARDRVSEDEMVFCIFFGGWGQSVCLCRNSDQETLLMFARRRFESEKIDIVQGQGRTKTLFGKGE